MVTHDRYFLDRVCSEIIEIDNRQLYQYKGNYSYYREKREERIYAKSVEIERANNLYRTELDWMRRMPQARGHKARYREDAFYELEKVAKQHIRNDNVKLEVKASYIGSKIFEADHLYKSFGDLKILDDFSDVYKRQGQYNPRNVWRSKNTEVRWFRTYGVHRIRFLLSRLSALRDGRGGFRVLFLVSYNCHK